MSIMDSHSTTTLARSNTATQALFDTTTPPQPSVTTPIAVASGDSTNNPSSSSSHSLHQSSNHYHHQSQSHHHHQLVDSSAAYHHHSNPHPHNHNPHPHQQHPFRTITPNSAESNSKIVDSQPHSKNSPPASHHLVHSRPSSGSNHPDWSASASSPAIAPQQPHQPQSNLRGYNPSTSAEGTAREVITGPGGGNYPSPTGTSTSRRSSSNLNPSPIQSELVPSNTPVPVSAPGPQYFQAHPAQESNLAMIAAIDCSGMDVRPIYDDPRQSQSQGQSHSPSQTSSSGRGQPSSEDIRASYYGQAPQYSQAGASMLPSSYPHINATPAANQPTHRRSTSGAGSPYSHYNQLSVPLPITSTAYNQTQGHHHQHSDSQVVPGWSQSVVSVRDTVSPYSRPSRSSNPGSVGVHNVVSPTGSYGSTLRNGQILHPHHTAATNPAHHHHPPGTMQYNAQGRPLAYMCNTCLRAFDRPSALQIHERSHTGERPFPCPWNGCVKRFTTHGNMVKHSRVCPFREPED